MQLIQIVTILLISCNTFIHRNMIYHKIYVIYDVYMFAYIIKLICILSYNYIYKTRRVLIKIYIFMSVRENFIYSYILPYLYTSCTI